jgi:hypothetical protein
VLALEVHLHYVSFYFFLFRLVLTLLVGCAAAALALLDQPSVDAEAIVRKSMKIAGDICVYTNHNLVVEKINPSVPEVPVIPLVESTDPLDLLK